MSTISKPYTHSSGQVIASAEVNSNFDTIYNDYNGSISNANIAANAAIADTKLGTISTAGKVNTTALTTTSQAAGDILYNNGSGWVRLAKGTANYFLHTNATATAPEWVAFASAAEVLTGTDATKPVTASTVIGHQGVAKGWVMADGSGAESLLDSYNTDSISDAGNGNYTITWTTDFGSANYAVVAMAGLNGTTHSFSTVLNDTATNPAAGTVKISNFDPTNGNAATEADRLCVIAIGDR